MFAYSPTGSKIIGTFEQQHGVARGKPGSYERLANGEIDINYTGYTDWYEDSQGTLTRDGETIFLDEDGEEWASSQIVLRTDPLADGEELSPDEIPTSSGSRLVATYTVHSPEGGLRDLSSFSPAEKAKLRPIAEVFAMLDGNSFFGMTTDENGDDTHYEQYLPEAAALVATTSGCDLASFMRSKIEYKAAERLPIDATFLNAIEDENEPVHYVQVSNIDWDIDPADDEEDSDDPALPKEVYMVTSEDPQTFDLANALSDKFGFCVNGFDFDAVAPFEYLHLPA